MLVYPPKSLSRMARKKLKLGMDMVMPITAADFPE